MSYYKRHLFFCTNQAEEGKLCCNQHGAKNLHQYAKEKVKALGVHQPGDYRVNKASCLGRCDQGPVVVVYPDDVWYTYVDREDVDEIIEEHLLNGCEVARLKLKG